MPPLRLLILLDVADHAAARTSEVTKRLQRPRSTVDRVLQELHLLGLLEVDDDADDGKGWQYALAQGIGPSSIDLLRPVTRNVTTPTGPQKEGSNGGTSKSGHAPKEGHMMSPPLAPADATTATPLQACVHGIEDGDQPDPFVSGRARCPQCRSLQLAAAS